MNPTDIKLDNRARVLKLIDLLEREYPDAKTALNYTNPLELLIATILSAQCTDRTVNTVTETLFQKYRTAEDYTNADPEELEEDVRSTGFYRNKAKNIRRCCQILVDKFDSHVPKTMDELLSLSGVARKTANIVLSNAYNVIEGIAVDTHVRRLAGRLGLTEHENPNKIEDDLMKIVPKKHWKQITDLLIFHGRRICTARRPKCGICILNRFCPSALSVDPD